MKTIYRDKLRDTFLEIRDIKGIVSSNPTSTTNRYLQSYLVLKCCSVVETLAKSMIFDKVAAGVNARLNSYLEKRILRPGTNPKYKKIYDLLNGFDSTNWSEPFKNTFQGTHYVTDLDSLVNVRNSIAHGESVLVPSVQRIYELFVSSCFVLNHLSNIPS